MTGTVFSHRQYTADDQKFRKRDDMGDIVTFSDYRQYIHYIDGLLQEAQLLLGDRATLKACQG